MVPATSLASPSFAITPADIDEVVQQLCAGLANHDGRYGRDRFLEQRYKQGLRLDPRQKHVVVIAWKEVQAALHPLHLQWDGEIYVSLIGLPELLTPSTLEFACEADLHKLNDRESPLPAGVPGIVASYRREVAAELIQFLACVKTTSQDRRGIYHSCRIDRWQCAGPALEIIQSNRERLLDACLKPMGFTDLVLVDGGHRPSHYTVTHVNGMRPSSCVIV
jgi:hypothetical protein